MSYTKVLVVSDNERIVNFFIDILNAQPNLRKIRHLRFVCGPEDTKLIGKKFGDFIIEGMDIKEDYEEIIRDYDLVISAHCKQIFPAKLTTSTKCINIHPGLNPFNRGWYPQVFSILNGLPLGATIHEIDPEIDHGAIIDQIEVAVDSWDTSLDAYNKVQDAERELIERSIESILNGTYNTLQPREEGNLNLKKDFEALREINLDEAVTFGQAIDRLRALSHGEFKNAYFYDKNTNQKIYISVRLEREK
ncbi:dTDP-4-amino-4,6-dideoxyglucose formyltransferase [Candidatus Saccharibacteria bacterium]|nr:dTDP-4-amino-4,6-dideoxyglucose formyltransferase [Candidatus Saccharibacteria bacterium]